jgi:Holliday junction resolvase RusA-like endonuclease
MKILQLKINGRIPSKKNSRNIFVKGNRRFNIPSERYRKWHIDATKQLIGTEKILGEIEIQIEFWMPDNRRADLTNKAESVMDLLVDLKIITDDSWQCVPSLTLQSKGIDKINPRAEIWIRTL